MQRSRVINWVKAGLSAVDPEELVRVALPKDIGHQTVIAIGKAAPAMVRGVARRATVSGVCVSNRPAEVPAGVELVVGEHPLPGPGSLEAGKLVLEMRDKVTLALISGGGSSLCELPIPGLEIDFVRSVTSSLLRSGLPIETINLTRSTLSQIKCGGLGAIKTMVLSDVAGQPPSVVSSGPTSYFPRDPEAAIEVIESLETDLTTTETDAIQAWKGSTPFQTDIQAIGDGMTAANAVAEAVRDDGLVANVADYWITGQIGLELDLFLSGAGEGVTIGTGEPTLRVTGQGRGGRNTHVALEAARRIEGSDLVFAAIATDGRDGNTDVGGAVVDGNTVASGGDPTRALEEFDSATYLKRVGAGVDLGLTNTNVADLWLLWRSGLN